MDWKEEFTREELEAMEEETPLETGEQEQGPETHDGTEETIETEQETSETEKTEGEQGEAVEAEEEETPEEGKPVPYERFSKIYGRAKQTERERDTYKEKLDLFKRDRDEYFEKFPDEKPEGYKSAAEPPPTKILSMRELVESGAAVNDPVNPTLHGKTLTELLEMGPTGIAAANDYYREYVDDVQGKVKEHQAKEEEAKKLLKSEDDAFVEAQAQALFSKSSKDLDAVQQDKVDKAVKDTLKWMKDNKRMAYKLADAWKLMTYEKAMVDAASKGAKSLVDHAKKGTIKSVGVSAGSTDTDPYAKYLAMTETDLTELLMTMPDDKYTDFLKKATPTFRNKFPNLAYLN